MRNENKEPKENKKIVEQVKRRNVNKKILFTFWEFWK